ncbi:MAG: PKD domain-containing protein, partial [Euryarchaeota archaeon]|nr:PKD domain-containing protein [Euryarchaeota archaeon]
QAPNISYDRYREISSQDKKLQAYLSALVTSFNILQRIGDKMVILISKDTDSNRAEQTYSLLSTYSVLSTDSLLEDIIIRVTYESGKTVELTPDNALCDGTEDLLMCVFEPKEAGEAIIEIMPTHGGTFGFDGNVIVMQFEMDGVLGVFDIVPSSGKNIESLDVAISGQNFQEGMRVQLTRTGNDAIPAECDFMSPYEITCTLPLTGAPLGLWNVTVTNPDEDSATLIDAFEVVEGCVPTPTTTYNITSKNGQGAQYGGIAVPTGEWQLDACAEFVISFDSRPGYVLEHISVNEELLPPQPYIRRFADRDYDIVAVGALRDQQIRVDFTAELCTDDSCEVSVPCTETPCTGTVPLSVVFIPKAISGVPDTWIWDFGNGESKETPNTEERKRVQTQYTMPGLYTVTLTGKQDELSGTVTKIEYIYAEPTMK